MTTPDGCEPSERLRKDLGNAITNNSNVAVISVSSNSGNLLTPEQGRPLVYGQIGYPQWKIFKRGNERYELIFSQAGYGDWCEKQIKAKINDYAPGSSSTPCTSPDSTSTSTIEVTTTTEVPTTTTEDTSTTFLSVPSTTEMTSTTAGPEYTSTTMPFFTEGDSPGGKYSGKPIGVETIKEGICRALENLREPDNTTNLVIFVRAKDQESVPLELIKQAINNRGPEQLHPKIIVELGEDQPQTQIELFMWSGEDKKFVPVGEPTDLNGFKNTLSEIRIEIEGRCPQLPGAEGPRCLDLDDLPSVLKRESEENQGSEENPKNPKNPIDVCSSQDSGSTTDTTIPPDQSSTTISQEDSSTTISQEDSSTTISQEDSSKTASTEESTTATQDVGTTSSSEASDTSTTIEEGADCPNGTVVDADGDGKVTVQEVACSIAALLKNAEGQPIGCYDPGIKNWADNSLGAIIDILKKQADQAGKESDVNNQEIFVKIANLLIQLQQMMGEMDAILQRELGIAQDPDVVAERKTEEAIERQLISRLLVFFLKLQKEGTNATDPNASEPPEVETTFGNTLESLLKNLEELKKLIESTKKEGAVAIFSPEAEAKIYELENYLIELNAKYLEFQDLYKKRMMVFRVARKKWNKIAGRIVGNCLPSGETEKDNSAALELVELIRENDSKIIPNTVLGKIEIPRNEDGTIDVTKAKELIQEILDAYQRVLALAAAIQKDE